MCLGTVGLVIAVRPARCVEVRAGGRDITASLLTMTDAVGLGDWVLVHSGLVLARLTEQEARDALELRDPTSEGDP
ncbi:MAG: HypC/HybG/HupF family hydrogenase formation chaperone [Actinobacteria bacterium]|nr:HypC/HybG/HupF family hydrogenase formation chaperone [Actinomycetota bacterium]